MCVSSLEAHEETLRLILAAAPTLDAQALASLVERTLVVTRKSRKAHKKTARKPPGYEHEPPTGARGVVAGLRGGHGSGRRSFGSFGSSFGALARDAPSAPSAPSRMSKGAASATASAPGAGHVSDAGADTDGVGSGFSREAGSARGADGVRATYQLLAQREGARLTAASAPRLREYLARRDREDGRRGGGFAEPVARDAYGDEPFSSGEFRTFSPALTG